MTKRTLLAAVVPFYLALIVYCLVQATRASADGGPPPTPPTPGPVVNTGGNISGGDPGSSCALRLGVRTPSYTPSSTYTWAQSGDSGWAFGWGGLPWPATPTTAPSVGCSR